MNLKVISLLMASVASVAAKQYYLVSLVYKPGQHPHDPSQPLGEVVCGEGDKATLEWSDQHHRKRGSFTITVKDGKASRTTFAYYPANTEFKLQKIPENDPRIEEAAWDRFHDLVTFQ